MTYDDISELCRCIQQIPTDKTTKGNKTREDLQTIIEIMELSLPKKYREIHLYGSAKTLTVALTESPDRAEVMSSKDNVIELDGNIIKSSAIAAVRGINPFVNENADSAMAYARSLQAPLRYVAIERVTKRE
jgi:hypothetical protein